MKKLFLLITAMIALAASAQEAMLTPWGENVDTVTPWNVYPRPIMERGEWLNLNGKWDYAIRPVGETAPQAFDGKILVPFPVESELSGVKRRVGDENELWYRRTFNIPADWKGKNVNLNFGAVDWKCRVWVNGNEVGSHAGGYSPFSLDITDALNAAGENELVVSVYDPTDKGTQPRGKQVTNPRTIWYTPVTGIWQTVWLEPVGKAHITDLKITPDVDANTLTVNTTASQSGYDVTIDVLDNGVKVASATGRAGEDVAVAMPADVKLWSTEAPNLYDLQINLVKKGKPVDSVKSYAAMRKISMERGLGGVMRFQLNDRDIFHFGPLDQGWWPDGLYTAPSYEALIYDIDKTKEFGFNMIRKHIKVEPAVWYAYCDRAGIIVWQDMPSGDKTFKWYSRDYYKEPEWERTPESAEQYRTEWKEIIDNLYNYPSIAVWVPFNEGWGQFDTKGIAEWTKELDPTRLVNPASGGNHFDCGDILDIHNYPAPQLVMLDYERANVLGEYGGIGYAIEGHLWAPDRNWGYVQYKSPEEVTDEYVRFIDILAEQGRHAYTGAVYTQTTDVEIEVNGLMTYDRKVDKIDVPRVAAANRALIESLSNREARTFDIEVTDFD